MNVISPTVDNRVEVFWPIYNAYYASVLQKTYQLTACSPSTFAVDYNDSEQEKLDMSNQTWRLDSTITASSAVMPQLSNNEQNVFAHMFNPFEDKTFHYNQAQGFDFAALINKYKIEENSLKRTI